MEKNLGKLGYVCVCVCARTHMCQYKCVTHRRMLVVVDSHYGGTNPEAPERLHTPAVPFPHPLLVKQPSQLLSNSRKEHVRIIFNYTIVYYKL